MKYYVDIVTVFKPMIGNSTLVRLARVVEYRPKRHVTYVIFTYIDCPIHHYVLGVF